MYYCGFLNWWKPARPVITSLWLTIGVVIGKVTQFLIKILTLKRVVIPHGGMNIRYKVSSNQK